LKILFLATRDWYNPAKGGGDIVMWENARYLASVGHDVTYVAAGYHSAAKEEEADGLKVVRLGRIHTLWFRTFVYYLARARGQFDVVVAEGFGGSRIPRLVPLYIREPIITEWHQVYRELFAAQYPKFMGGPLNLLEKISAWVNRNTLVRAGTEEWRQPFVELGFREGNVFVLPVSIREEWLDDFGPTESREPNIMWLGKMRRYKRPDHVIRAMTKVVEEVPGARLTIVGRHDDREYEERLKALVADLDLEHSVEFRFNVTEEEKHALFRRSRALVVSSVLEGFGIVVLEASACGVPVIASSGVPEGAVREGGNGLRYPYGDIDALATAMCRIIQDDGLHRSLSDGGREFAQGFGWRSVGARYAAVVEGAVARIQAPLSQRQLEHETPS
jgi:glycosyltransferase involved in cell wall biosynthesis